MSILRVYKYQPEGLNSVYEKSLEGVMELLKETGCGDKIIITPMKMSEMEYQALPEFEGF